MKNQEKEIIDEAILSLKNLALENRLTSFSILSTDSIGEHYLDAIVCGKPADLIFSLILAMDKSPDIYKILKTAIVAYENKEGILSTAVSLTMDKKELLKSIFSKIHNG